MTKLIRDKISNNRWNEYVFKTFTDEEISFLFGLDLQRYLRNSPKLSKSCVTYVDLGYGVIAEVKKDSSRLLISPEKAGIITWICTDGYLEINKRGYYIRIRDSDSKFLPHLKKLITSVYGNTKIDFRKIRNKNAFQARICSKKIVSDLITYIPLSGTRNWSIPIELLDEKGIIEILRILSQTEGSIFIHNRTRMIEITLANLNALIQAKYLFEKLGISTTKIREDFSGGYERYKFGISTRENLEKFRDKINFIPKTDKFYKFEKILNGYKEYHRTNCDYLILETLKKRPFILSKELIKLTGMNRTTVSRNVNKLRKMGKIDYRKTRGNGKLWYIKI